MVRRRRELLGGKPRPDCDAAGRGKRGTERGEPTPGQQVMGWIRSISLAVLVWLLFTSFLVKTFVIDSGSMEETLLVGDFVIVNRAALGGRVPLTDFRMPGYAEPERGDIMVFDPPHEDTLVLVKRLIGMPGDTLEMRAKALFVNGEPQDEPYVFDTGLPDRHDSAMMWQQDYLLGGVRDGYLPTRDTWGPIVIPPNHYLMMGDHRDDSLDSRTWGLVERWRLEGRVAAIYFSYNRSSFRPFPWIKEVRAERIGKRF